jgi:membrane-associated phospholipid phosphatase
MVATAFLWTLVMHLCGPAFPRGVRYLGATGLRVLALLALGLVAASRVHTGAHFPSQTLAGLVAGLAVARVTGGAAWPDGLSRALAAGPGAPAPRGWLAGARCVLLLIFFFFFFFFFLSCV